MQLLDVMLQLDLITGADFRFGDNAVSDKEVNVLLIYIMRHGLGQRTEVAKTAACGFLHPLGGVVVAVEDDVLVLGEYLPDKLLHGFVQVVRVFQHIVELAEFLGHHRVEHVVRTAYI